MSVDERLQATIDFEGIKIHFRDNLDGSSLTFDQFCDLRRSDVEILINTLQKMPMRATINKIYNKFGSGNILL